MLGMFLAIAVWLITCKAYLGEINVVNLSDRWVSFAGNASALFLGGIFSVGFSLIWPDDFDWNNIRNKTILLEAGDPDGVVGSGGAAQEDTKDVVAEAAEEKVYQAKDTTHVHEAERTSSIGAEDSYNAQGGESYSSVIEDPDLPQVCLLYTSRCV